MITFAMSAIAWQQVSKGLDERLEIHLQYRMSDLPKSSATVIVIRLVYTKAFISSVSALSLCFVLQLQLTKLAHLQDTKRT